MTQLSQYRRRGAPCDWSRAGNYAQHVLSQLLAQEIATGTFWNVNFPDLAQGGLPEILECTLDPHPLPVGFELREGAFYYRSNYHLRPQEPGGDVETCFGGQIALTLMQQRIQLR